MGVKATTNEVAPTTVVAATLGSYSRNTEVRISAGLYSLSVPWFYPVTLRKFRHITFKYVSADYFKIPTVYEHTLTSFSAT